MEDRWHLEYPATNNAVANGGIVAACVWFGQGDFLKTNVYVNNKLMEKRIMEGAGASRSWQDIQVDLSAFANQTARLRLYQRVLVPNKTAGNAYWKSLKIE